MDADNIYNVLNMLPGDLILCVQDCFISNNLEVTPIEKGTILMFIEVKFFYEKFELSFLSGGKVLNIVYSPKQFREVAERDFSKYFSKIQQS